MLARLFEATGFSTILVTMMPFWSEKVGVPRTLAVEHPFGLTLGQPNDPERQQHVIREAFSLLESATEPGTIAHSDYEWPIAARQARKQWQPLEASPIIAVLAPQLRQMLRAQRKKAST